ncbi:MAG: aldose 1-epimerase family protein [Firmicutes bacterium]|nr:aldose 1-epimerase family protein [Bacillota bacterium]
MKYDIQQGDLSICIDAYGAQLTSVKWQGREYLWQGDPAYWPDQSLMLFPYVGRFTEGKYTFRGKTYPMDIHGFAKDSMFEIADAGDDHVTFVLQDSEETRAVYPFQFILSVTYIVRGNTVSVSYEVVNPSEETMYFGIGGHPGFQVPMENGLSFDDYYLEFSRPHTPDHVGHTEGRFLSGIDAPVALEGGVRLPLHHDLFDDDAYVLKNVADTVTIRSDLGARSVTMHYPGLPYLGIWHMPQTDAPYICLEPWSSLPSRQDIIEDLEFKCDLIRLAAGGTYFTEWSMTLT